MGNHQFWRGTPPQSITDVESTLFSWVRVKGRGLHQDDFCLVWVVLLTVFGGLTKKFLTWDEHSDSHKKDDFPH